MFAQNFWGNWADLETHYGMKVPHEISLFSQLCLQIWYSVIVLCPESQDRGSSKPLPSACISAPSSEFFRRCWLPCQPLCFCQAGVECCHPESLSSFLCSQKPRTITALVYHQQLSAHCQKSCALPPCRDSAHLSPANTLSLHAGCSLHSRSCKASEIDEIY